MNDNHFQADPSVQMLMYIFAVCGLSSLGLLVISSLCCYLCHRRQARKDEEGITTADSAMGFSDVFYRKKGKSPLSAPTITSQADLFSRGGPPSFTLDSLRERELPLSYSPAFVSFSQRLHNHFAATTEQPKSISIIDSDQPGRYDSLVPTETAYLHATQ